eukprot:6283563-Amphidinium_carterae.1
MSERQMPSLAAFEECQSTKCLHLQRLRNAFEECESAMNVAQLIGASCPFEILAAVGRRHSSNLAFSMR